MDFVIVLRRSPSSGKQTKADASTREPPVVIKSDIHMGPVLTSISTNRHDILNV